MISKNMEDILFSESSAFLRNNILFRNDSSILYYTQMICVVCNDCNFKACNLFRIRMPTLLSIIGVIVSYIVIIYYTLYLIPPNN